MQEVIARYLSTCKFFVPSRSDEERFSFYLNPVDMSSCTVRVWITTTGWEETTKKTVEVSVVGTSFKPSEAMLYAAAMSEASMFALFLEGVIKS